MGPKLATVVVEFRLLVREALKSLMTKNSYRVVCDIGSSAEISSAATSSDEPKLVILGAQSADNALAEAAVIRKLLPDSKIILLYEFTSLVDFQKLLTSEIDGCVPLFASPDTLISTLDLIVIRDVRVVVLAVIEPAQPANSQQSEIKVEKVDSDGAEHEDVSVTNDALRDAQATVTLQNAGLSEREAQILDGLGKGYSNKVIARTCDLSEATVKSHIKSIMRKIGVVNRTQAAMWVIRMALPQTAAFSNENQGASARRPFKRRTQRRSGVPHVS